MSQRAKLVDDVRNNPGHVRFEDACKIAAWLGFQRHKRTGTSHAVYVKANEPKGLNFQNWKGFIPRYQAEQLIEAIDKYWCES